jgi:hypothetical protein
VEKESDPCVGQLPPDHLRHEHQLIVVNPDEIAGSIPRDRRVGEPAIHRLVRGPGGRAKRQPIEEVVEQRPQHAVRELLVILPHLVAREVNGDDTSLGELIIEG